mmetsp:Transcript_78566/g.163229  ORF Transcript_78566/g.163229 Transcript_78566/m.163229 type:complete len:502 (+) Transcript_78566:115-1620(+)
MAQQPVYSTAAAGYPTTNAKAAPPLAPHPVSPSQASTAEIELMNYLQDRFTLDEPLNVMRVQELLCAAGGNITWSAHNEDGLPCLHLACMNEATEPEELKDVIRLLAQSGADLNAEDEDGDTALAAVMSLTEDADQQNEGEEDEDLQATKQIHLAAVEAILGCSQLILTLDKVKDVCQWLRRHIDAADREPVLEVLRTRFDENLVDRVWTSEEMLAYLEKKAYTQRKPLDSSIVKAYLERGAYPSQSQNGASALLLVVLNPYSPLAELEHIFHDMLSVDPSVAAMLDGFKLGPLQWASDYRSVAQQHGLARPNPANLLALLPAICKLCPPEVDAGEACYKVFEDGTCASVPPKNAPEVRFMEGQRVFCRVEAPGGQTAWEEGIIVGMWYREGCWPETHPGAPYEIRLMLGLRVFALVDDDRIVRSTKVSEKGTGAAAAAGAVPAGSDAAAAEAGTTPSTAAAPGPRFQKRERPDGKWELFDTKSGKARPCSPPDSDDDDDD